MFPNLTSSPSIRPNITTPNLHTYPAFPIPTRPETGIRMCLLLEGSVTSFVHQQLVKKKGDLFQPEGC